MSRRFRNLDPKHRPHDTAAVFRWAVWDRLRGRRKISPPGPGAPSVALPLQNLTERKGVPRITWLGHSSFHLCIAGRRVLVDPVLSRRIGAFYPRHAPLPLEPKDLPEVDLLLVTHNHYDHLDAATIRHLPASTPVLVPAGLGTWFRRRDFREVREMTWWEEIERGPLQVSLVPARHWSRRTPFDTNQSLWGGFVIRGEGRSVYHAGDSGWSTVFAEIGERYPGLDAALLPVGAYEPAWFMEPAHMNPEQAGEAFLAVGARRLIPMHWGTYQLTDEPVSEPIERLEAWWGLNGPKLEGRHLSRLAVGESVEL